jgi:hypothetical protein
MRIRSCGGCGNHFREFQDLSVEDQGICPWCNPKRSKAIKMPGNSLEAATLEFNRIQTEAAERERIGQGRLFEAQ